MEGEADLPSPFSLCVCSKLSTFKLFFSPQRKRYLIYSQVCFPVVGEATGSGEKWLSEWLLPYHSAAKTCSHLRLLFIFKKVGWKIHLHVTTRAYSSPVLFTSDTYVLRIENICFLKKHHFYSQVEPANNKAEIIAIRVNGKFKQFNRLHGSLAVFAEYLKGNRSLASPP